MYNLGEIFYLDKEYSARAKFCNENGYVIKEIEPDEKGRRFQIQEIPKPTQKELNQQEYYELKDWFNNVYSYKEQKYRRLIALNKLDDDGIEGQTKLNNLYYEAEEKRKRIQELENLLSTGV